MSGSQPQRPYDQPWELAVPQDESLEEDSVILRTLDENSGKPIRVFSACYLDFQSFLSLKGRLQFHCDSQKHTTRFLNYRSHA